MPTEQNPILNNPYEEPDWHYATNLAGELDYSRPVKGRRIFTPEIQSIPVRQGAQGELMELNEVAAADHGSHVVNLLRREVGAWRQAKYPQTTRITRELLQFWFLNPERDMTQSLFFAQREAIETAIWLNEVAEKSNVGQHVLRQLEEAQRVSASPENNLPRIAFKMATGSRKTVVMAALIAYHYFNRAEYRNDVRFADNFLLIAPGITIRDRLGVLRVDTRSGVEAEDYYHVHYLVPQNWRKEMPELNKRLVITNYHAFEPKTLQGNKRSPFDGKIQADGMKQEATEDYSHVIARLLGNFRPGSRLLVINDEAHHCYLPREDDQKAEGEDTAEENRRAAVWFNGLVRITQRFKVRSIYDLKQAVTEAIKACRDKRDGDWLLILGFAFESGITELSRSFGNFQVSIVRMHDDLLQQGLLKKDKKAASFVTIGEPDIRLHKDGDNATVEIAGLDIYDPIKDVVNSRDVHDIAYWMVDDDYDGSNFVVRQVFFCGGDKDEFDEWKRGLSDLAKAAAKKKAEQTLKIEIDDAAFSRIYGHKSHPFPVKKGQKIAVRVISQFGEETTKVLEMK